MSGEPTDEELMLAYGAGDAGAFQQLYSRHRTPLFRHMVRRLRDTPLAEELFQDVWQRVIAARERWRPEAKFATWLYQVAHNRIADHWRAKQYRPDAPDDADELAARVPDPETPERALSATAASVVAAPTASAAAASCDPATTAVASASTASRSVSAATGASSVRVAQPAAIAAARQLTIRVRVVRMAELRSGWATG